MDKSVPAGARKLLDFIGSYEAPQGYDTIYGNNQSKLPKPITQMTLGELLEAQLDFTKRLGSSAAGFYQIIRPTLSNLVAEFRLPLAARFDPDMQDDLGLKLLQRRGYAEYMAGSISRTEFGRRLAMEWASLPVLAPCRGAHRDLTRGQSYYEGDALNHARAAPERFEAVLDEVRAAVDEPSPAAPSRGIWALICRLWAAIFGGR